MTVHQVTHELECEKVKRQSLRVKGEREDKGKAEANRKRYKDSYRLQARRRGYWIVKLCPSRLKTSRPSSFKGEERASKPTKTLLPLRCPTEHNVHSRSSHQMTRR